jgi:hypothetical protein
MGILSEQINGSQISVNIASSNIKSASYNTDSKVLTIIFKTEAVYEYYDVPWEIFTRFRMSESQGKYFSTNINGKYKHKKV